MDEVTIIRIDTGQSVQSVNDLRQNIKLLKEQLGELEIGSQEYQETLQKLKVNQNALRDAMYATGSSMEQVAADAKGLSVVFNEQGKLVNAEKASYNALVHTLADLKTQWRTTTDEAERADLGKRINAVNDRLKDMDASVGSFKRNVGNYSNSIVDAFGKMGGSIGGMAAPIKQATTALDVMGKTPVLAVMGLLAGVLDSVIKNLKTSEENTQALTAAMAPLQSIGDAVTKVLQGLGKGVAWLVDQFGKLTTRIFGVNKAAQDRIDLANQEIALDKQRRENLVANAAAERDIAELRAKASQRDLYTASQRLEFLEHAGEKERQIADRARQEAKDTYDALKLRTSLTASSKEDLDALAQAEAAWIKADTDYYRKVREINAGIAEAKQQEVRERREAAKAADEEAKRVRDAANAKIAAEKDYIAALLSVTKEGTQEAFNLQNQLAEKEREKAIADAKTRITDADTLAKTLEIIEQKYQLAIEKNREDHEKRLREQQLLAVANRRDALERGSVEYLTAEVEYQKAALAALVQASDETDEAFKARTIAAQKAVVDAQTALADAQEGIERTARENRLNSLREGSDEYLREAVSLKQWELDTLHQLEGESDEAFRARQIAAEKEHTEALKALWQARVQTFGQVASGIGELLTSLADIYESDTSVTAAEARKIKNLRIAAATIEMLNGVVTAIAQAQSLGPVLGPIMAGINSAAVIAAGTANINKIKSTQISTSGSSSSSTPAGTVAASVPAPSFAPQVQQVRTVTSASEEERLNQMAKDQRVYIVASDIEASQDAIRTRVRESTF